MFEFDEKGQFDFQSKISREHVEEAAKYIFNNASQPKRDRLVRISRYCKDCEIMISYSGNQHFDD